MPRMMIAACWLLVSLCVSLGDAVACACCTNEGQRNVGTRALDARMREEIGRLVFASKAELYVGEGDAESVKGIGKTSGRFDLRVVQEAGRWTFNFRDKAGGAGSLTLAMPATVAVFEVDPRAGEPAGGQGPAIYKEWKLTANAAGSGLFAPGVGGGQRITLILQGRGNNCSGGDMFSHWTLAVFGPKAQYHLFGAFKHQ